MVFTKLLRVAMPVALSVILLQAGFFLFFQTSRTPPAQADLIMVFNGAPARIVAGFKLAQDGYAPNVAISGLGMPQIAAQARKYRLPGAARLIPSGKCRSTFEDVFRMRQIVEQHHIKSVLLVTSSHHLPRAYLLSRLFLVGTGVRLEPFAVSDERQGGKASVLLKGQLLMNEMVKFWGSSFEMAGYLISGRLLLDSPVYLKISQSFKKKVLF